MPKPSALALTLPSIPLPSRDQDVSSSFGPLSAPIHSPNRKKASNGDSCGQRRTNKSPVTYSHATPSSPASPTVTSERSKGLFSNLEASKSSTRIVKEHALSVTSKFNSDSVASIYTHRHNPGSTPELSLIGERGNTPEILHKDSREHIKSQHVFLRNDSDLSVRRETSIPRLDRILGRSNSTSEQDLPSQHFLKSSAPTSATSSRSGFSDKKPKKINGDLSRAGQPEKERSLRERMASNIRNRSADRNVAVESEDDSMPPPRDKREAFSLSSSFKDGSGSNFLSNIKHGSSKAADGIGKAGKGIFGKLARSGSGPEREGPRLDDDYVCKVIHLPLVEQTRRTRISKRLADSKDKTEFWMPALPWRCIDYLNMKGCEAEGLYRVPGSGRDIRYWQMRFDKEHDINLFDEPDLYDINIIGSMFKAWLRELPDEIFPRSIQDRIATECKDAKETPKMLKDELSKLPPFNYYLLFAITCHISLLHSCAQHNKMDYRNLCICFQPCLKVDGFCFQFLVLDWRNCWQGCWTEESFLSTEMRLLDDLEVASVDRQQHQPQSQRNQYQKHSKSKKTTGIMSKQINTYRSQSDSRSAMAVPSSTSLLPQLTADERMSSSGSGASSSKFSDTRSSTPDNTKIDGSKMSQLSMHTTYQVSTPQQAIAQALPPSPLPQSPKHAMTLPGHVRQHSYQKHGKQQFNMDSVKQATEPGQPFQQNQQQHQQDEQIIHSPLYAGSEKSVNLTALPPYMDQSSQRAHEGQSRQKTKQEKDKNRHTTIQKVEKEMMSEFDKELSNGANAGGSGSNNRDMAARRRSSAPDRAVTTGEKDEVVANTPPTRRTSIQAPALLEPVQPLSPIGSI